MAFTAYNARVKLATAAGGSIPPAVVLPVDTLRIKPVPYTPEGSTIITLFRGDRKFVPPTFGYTVELEWANLGQRFERLQDAVEYLISAGQLGTVLNLYVSQTNSGEPATFDEDIYVPDVLGLLDGDTLNTIFEQRMRKKRGKLTLVTKKQDLALFDWVASNNP